MDKKLREEILEHAHEILNDEILLSALIEAGDKNLGSKIVDLRSIAMQKMDGELKKLKRSNQQVIATAYENLVGMKQVHQVVLKLLEKTMPIKPNVRTGNVDWTGENPGMLLKTDPAGDWSVLMLFFRIVWSPVGPGNILLLYENPNKNAGMPECCNVIMADNEVLRDYIKTGFIEKLGTFGDVPAYSASSQLKIDKVVTEGDPCGDFYSETVIGDGLSIKLVWEELGKPTALELPPELTGTGEHVMYSLLVDSKSCFVEVNGRKLEGHPVSREQAGLELSTAFLYYSETWIFPDK